MSDTFSSIFEIKQLIDVIVLNSVRFTFGFNL